MFDHGIIIDYGSTDNSLSIINPFPGKELNDDTYKRIYNELYSPPVTNF
jgi:hypothetical protein